MSQITSLTINKDGEIKKLGLHQLGQIVAHYEHVVFDKLPMVHVVMLNEAAKATNISPDDMFFGTKYLAVLESEKGISQQKIHVSPLNYFRFAFDNFL